MLLNNITQSKKIGSDIYCRPLLQIEFQPFDFGVMPSIPPKIADFYGELLGAYLSSAENQLGERIKNEYGSLGTDEKKRYRNKYCKISSEAALRELGSREYLSVTIKISLFEGARRNRLYCYREGHIWNIQKQYLLSKKDIIREFDLKRSEGFDKKQLKSFCGAFFSGPSVAFITGNGKDGSAHDIAFPMHLER